ncbi:non-ribosomal peptide synthetase [Streptomyces sp. NPDC002467]|uniref:non-ribosomal peptide synthetase n=1 Tax=Streptomyces sp. NPDC002467 TaxID=3364647 RepID=UPI00367D83A2
MNTDDRTDLGAPLTLTELFARSAAAHGDSPAVSDDSGRRLTYAELDRASAELAQRLIDEGVRREDRVGIHRERDVDLVISILGVLRAGAAYAAVDLRYPKARRELMLRAADGRLTLVGPGEREQLGDQMRTMVWEYDAERAQADAPKADLPEAAPQDAACVLFTSGSTGTPKGVVVEHHNLVHFAANPLLPELSPADRVAQIANISFDTFHWELWSSFWAGAEIVMMPSVPDLVKGDPGRELRRRRITALLSPTMAFNHIAAEDADVFSSLRVLQTGGDVVRPAACRDVLASKFSGRLVNLYGPTEGTTAATAFTITDVAPDATSVPIGAGLAGVQLHVLDAQLRPVPKGTAGELHIGGAGVTRGYLRDPARTAERFLPDPFGTPGSVMYATGDLVSERPDGVLDYLGRNDDQVKIRGYRVEPREVERSLLACSGVLDVAVLPQGEGQDKRLVAFVVPQGRTTMPEVRAYAEATIPDYQVPSEFVQVPEIQSTAHGKRDTAALLELLGDRDRRRSDYVAPRTDSERYLTKVWEELLGTERISVNDDFFELGGNSMLAFRMSRRINRDQAAGIGLEDVLGNTVLCDMALALDASRSKGEDE